MLPVWLWESWHGQALSECAGVQEGAQRGQESFSWFGQGSPTQFWHLSQALFYSQAWNGVVARISTDFSSCGIQSLRDSDKHAEQWLIMAKIEKVASLSSFHCCYLWWEQLIRGCDRESPRAAEGAAVRGWLCSGAVSGLCTFCCIFPFSVILWLGDLNYRLEELDVAKVKQLVEEKAFLELCQYDQVLKSQLVLRVLSTNHTTPWPFLCSVPPFYSIWKLLGIT